MIAHDRNTCPEHVLRIYVRFCQICQDNRVRQNILYVSQNADTQCPNTEQDGDLWKSPTEQQGHETVLSAMGTPNTQIYANHWTITSSEGEKNVEQVGNGC